MSRVLVPGSLISHYRVVRPLGAGGMGEVYLAQDLTLERSVALKILPPQLGRGRRSSANHHAGSSPWAHLARELFRPVQHEVVAGDVVLLLALLDDEKPPVGN